MEPMHDLPETVGMTMQLEEVDLPEGRFWRAQTVMADGTKLEAFARDRPGQPPLYGRKMAAGYLYQKVGQHLCGAADS